MLELDPGALCTLHWHPDADKWQYVIEGEVSATLFASHGRYRAEGDVGYIPQGYGHSIENVGSGAARILIGFKAGVYGRSICRNVSRPTPADVLATNFRQPAELFGKFSDRDVSIAASGGT